MPYRGGVVRALTAVSMLSTSERSDLEGLEQFVYVPPITAEIAMDSPNKLTALTVIALTAAACGQSSGTDTSTLGTDSQDATSDTSDVSTSAEEESSTEESSTETTDGEDTSDETTDATSGSPWGQVVGHLYQDLNANGVRDDDELGVKSHRIFQDLNDDGLWQEEEPYDVTDENGRYIFENLIPGLYRIYLEPYKDIQTQPAEITEAVSDFSADLDPADWTVSGDGVTVANGELTILRNSMDDAAALNATFDGALDVGMKARWDSQADPEYFFGFRITAPCEEGSLLEAGIDVGRESWSGEWQVIIYNCTQEWGSYQYPGVPLALGTDYDIHVYVGPESMALEVDGMIIWDTGTGITGPFSVQFPHRWDEFATPGIGAQMTIDDLAVRAFKRLPQLLEVYAGDLIDDADFGRITIEE